MLEAPTEEQLAEVQDVVAASGIHHAIQNLENAVAVFPEEIQDRIFRAIESMQAYLENPTLSLFTDIKNLLRFIDNAIRKNAAFENLSNAEQANLIHLLDKLEEPVNAIHRNLETLFNQAPMKEIRQKLQKEIQDVLFPVKETVRPSLDPAQVFGLLERISISVAYVEDCASNQKLFSDELALVDVGNKTPSEKRNKQKKLINHGLRYIKNSPLPDQVKHDFIERCKRVKDAFSQSPATADQECEVLFQDMQKALQPTVEGLHRAIFPNFGHFIDILTRMKVQDYCEANNKKIEDVPLSKYEGLRTSILLERSTFSIGDEEGGYSLVSCEGILDEAVKKGIFPDGKNDPAYKSLHHDVLEAKRTQKESYAK